MFRSFKLPLVATVGIIATMQNALAVAPTERVEVGRVVVSYRDLDLSSTSDAQLMLSRLQHAAYQACGGDPRRNRDYDLLGPKLKQWYRDCRSDAVSRAVTSVDAPVLSQVFRGEENRLVRATSN